LILGEKRAFEILIAAQTVIKEVIVATKLNIARINKKVTALSNALAKLGKGTDVKELIRIIRNPGWTTPAELAFTIAILDSMQGQADQLARLSSSLVKSAKRVSVRG
jgi:hypothetical protein